MHLDKAARGYRSRCHLPRPWRPKTGAAAQLPHALRLPGRRGAIIGSEPYGTLRQVETTVSLHRSRSTVERPDHRTLHTYGAGPDARCVSLGLPRTSSWPERRAKMQRQPTRFVWIQMRTNRRLSSGYRWKTRPSIAVSGRSGVRSAVRVPALLPPCILHLVRISVPADARSCRYVTYAVCGSRWKQGVDCSSSGVPLRRRKRGPSEEEEEEEEEEEDRRALFSSSGRIRSLPFGRRTITKVSSAPFATSQCRGALRPLSHFPLLLGFHFGTGRISVRLAPPRDHFLVVRATVGCGKDFASPQFHPHCPPPPPPPPHCPPSLPISDLVRT